ncbi:MAG TPA: FtsX-like permease family protein [Bacteroidota bacterium]|nr:FtsX-like permease family protein [Bacteroidota bacterium]
MIGFLLRGLLRDKHRSVLPVIIVGLGVILTVYLYSFMVGVFNDMIDDNARFDTGHVKIMTQAYNELSSQLPNDLAITGADSLINLLRKQYPSFDWVERIKFGGLIDIPDSVGETRAQGPIMGIGLDLIGTGSHESARMKLDQALVRGRLPRRAGEVMVSDALARDMDIPLGQTVTLLAASANGGMSVQNFVLVGTFAFGISSLDRSAMFADIHDIQYALEMEGCAGEILGFARSMIYSGEEAGQLKKEFARDHAMLKGEFAPVMLTLEDQNDLREYLQYAEEIGFIIVAVFIFAMSLVLWNAGLMSGIRRYGEVGVRLAMGESKPHIYRSLIYESICVGLIGSLGGTLIGLAVAYYFQEVGMDFSGTFRGSGLLMENVMRARVTTTSYYIGFIPGLLATLLGTMVSGVGIFKRQTATLFKELES